MCMIISKKKLLTLFIVIMLLSWVVIVPGCAVEPDEEPAEPEEPVEPDEEPVEPEEPVETFELSLAHFWPGAHVVETELVADWGKAIEEATDGQVKVESYPGGTLAPGPEIYESVVQGVADIGISVYAYTRGRFPVIETFLLPGIGYNTSRAASMAVMEGIERFDPEEIKDTKHILSFSTGPGHLMIDRPIQSMDDLSGLEIGATAGPRADAIEYLGATPVILPMPEWYEALERGMMVGGVAPLEVLEGFRLGEVTGDYITLTPLLYSQKFFMVMNLETWDSLPTDIQIVIEDVSAEYFEENLAGLWDRINESGLEWVKGMKPVEIIELSPEEEARWMEEIVPVQEEHRQFLLEQGLPADEILDAAIEIAEKYNEMYE